MRARLVCGAALAALALAGCAGTRHAPEQAGTTLPPRATTSTTRPPPVGVEVLLPKSSLRTGSTMAGQAVVVNRTGHALDVVGCGSIFQVALVSRTYRPVVVWPACASRITIPVGRTTYPVTVDARYSECTNAMPQPGIPACLPRAGAPPLPAGGYQATLYQDPRIAPRPQPIPIRVTG